MDLLIPCYNAAPFLPRILADARAQTRPFAAVCCYDDASTDDTAAVAARLGATVLRGKENRGAAFARNRLLEASRSRWVHFHDADDGLDAHYVERMERAAAGFDGAVLCAVEVFERATGEKLGIVSYGGLTHADTIGYFLNQMGLGSAGLYTRGWLEKVGGFREDLRGNEDPDLHVRLAHAGCPFRAVDEVLVMKIEQPSSFSRSNRTRCLRDSLRCLESYADDLPREYHVDIGRHAGSLAWLLYEAGEYQASRRALALARRFHAPRVRSPHAAVNWIAAAFGLEAVFALKKAKQRLWP